MEFFFVRPVKRKAGHVTNIPRTMSSLGKKGLKYVGNIIVHFKTNLPSCFKSFTSTGIESLVSAEP